MRSKTKFECEECGGFYLATSLHSVPNENRLVCYNCLKKYRHIINIGGKDYIEKLKQFNEMKGGKDNNE